MNIDLSLCVQTIQAQNDGLSSLLLIRSGEIIPGSDNRFDLK